MIFEGFTSLICSFDTLFSVCLSPLVLYYPFPSSVSCLVLVFSCWLSAFLDFSYLPFRYVFPANMAVTFFCLCLFVCLFFCWTPWIIWKICNYIMYKTGIICQGKLKMLYKAEWTEFGSLSWRGVKKSFVLCLLAIPWTHRLSWFCFLYWHFRCFQISHVFKNRLSTPVSILCIVCLSVYSIFYLFLY